MKLQTFGRTPPRDHEVMPGRHCEERSDEAIHASFMPRYGLLRFARNDGGWSSSGRKRMLPPTSIHHLPSPATSSHCAQL